MKRELLLLILTVTLLVWWVSGCVTRPPEDTAEPEPKGPFDVGEETAPIGPGQLEIEPPVGPEPEPVLPPKIGAEKEPRTEPIVKEPIKPVVEPEEPVVEEPPPPLEPPAVVVRPGSARVGERIVVSVRSPESGPEEYDSLRYDFGEGLQPQNAFTYVRFGVKTIRVRGFSGDRNVEGIGRAVIVGTASIVLDQREVQHHVGGEFPLKATIRGDGDYDEVRVLSDGRVVYTAPYADAYEFPVPFVGEREFEAALFMDGVRVADLPPVTITGLNTAPPPPQYEGETMLRARVGRELTFAMTAEDPNGDAVLYEVQFLPEGAEFDTATGQFRWTPTTADLGFHLMHFRAYDLPFMTKRSFSQRGVVVER